MSSAKAKEYPADLRRAHPRETKHPTGCADRLPERFIAKVAVDESTGCWVWKAATGLDGYGRLGNDGGRSASPRVVPAHRYAYEHVIGPVPDGLVLDHLCRNRLCANPWHLEPVTPAENSRRGAAANPDGLCRRGLHRLAETGTVEGVRCGECRREWDRARHERRRGRPARPIPAFRTHCPAGHPYAGENLRVKPNGHRECRTCHRERERARYHARKAAA